MTVTWFSNGGCSMLRLGWAVVLSIVLVLVLSELSNENNDNVELAYSVDLINCRCNFLL